MSPDTSAPQRTVIDRTADWQGALLYISDATGPTPEWGSIRIYDNVSGFVEKTVEQTVAANPSDVWVTADGGSMYVSGSDNGRIDKFRWDGNNWNRGGVVIDTPARLITSIAPGPDGNLYVTADDSALAGSIYKINARLDKIDGEPLRFPGLANLRDITWSPDGTSAYLCGTGAAGAAQLAIASWPSLAVSGLVDLPGSPRANRALTSGDGRFVYIMADNAIYIFNVATRSISATFSPSGRSGYRLHRGRPQYRRPLPVCHRQDARRGQHPLHR